MGADLEFGIFGIWCIQMDGETTEDPNSKAQASGCYRPEEILERVAQENGIAVDELQERRKRDSHAENLAMREIEDRYELSLREIW